MCRWIAYRGETTALEHYVTEPAHSLIAQSIQALEFDRRASMATVLGLAGTASTRSPAFTAKSGRPGPTKTCAICAGTCSRICSSPMSAPRPAPPITRPNCHPFACGKWLFMHNGFVGNWTPAAPPGRGAHSRTSFIRRASAPPIPKRSSWPSWAPASTIRWRATESVLARLTDLVIGPSRDRLRFTAALVERPGPLRLPLRGERSSQHALLPRIRARHRCRVRAAGPGSRNWIPVPENHVLVAKAGERGAHRAVSSSAPEAAE